jgi:hypothetical protein
MAYDCDVEIEDPFCDECGEETEAGRVRSVAFLNETAYTAVKADPIDETIWEAQVTAGNIKVIPNVRGSFDGGTPVKVDGYGDQKEKVIGYDCVLNFSDPVYGSNYPFYNSLAGRSSQYMAYRTESKTHLSEAKVTAAPKNPVEEDINSNVVWSVEVTWRQKNLVKPFDTPVGIFTC